MSMIYLDTCCLIYLIEDVPVFSAQTRKLLASNPDATLCVSPLVRLEVLVKPMQDANAQLVADYEDFLTAQRWLNIDHAVFDRALRLRARHRLKTPDALHLATSIQHGCAQFWTNDERLATASPLPIRSVHV